MKNATLTVIKSVLDSDESITPETRTAILSFCRNPAVTSAVPQQPITYLSPDQVAWALGLGLRTVQRMVANGTMPSRKIMSCRRIPSTVLDSDFLLTLSRPTKTWPRRKPTGGVIDRLNTMDKAS